MMPGDDLELRGWKAVARELGVSVRVAQSYVEVGLPVAWFDPWRDARRARRRRRGWSGVVVASRRELADWKRSRTFARRRAL